MNGIAFIFLLLNAVALLALPRRWAPLPLLACACYMTLSQSVQVGPFHFPILRLILLVGFVRVLARREGLSGSLNGLDKVMLAWGSWALISSAFVHPLVGQLGNVYNTLGIYFLIRIFCQNVEDIVHLVKVTAFVLAPVALEMIGEQLTGRNLFAFLGGVPDSVVVRGERLRAQGPFGHAILAGTVGAACLPLMIGIWRRCSTQAKIGLSACVVMVLASNSSGPLMSVIFGIFGLVMWRWRHRTRQMRIAAVVGYVILDLVMKAPAYYLIARVDLTGSSTGWHRAELIKQAIEHLDEWWLAGSLHTRHWMPYGVSWSEDHCDITNQYIGYGVFGGLPLMLLFIAALWAAFKYVGCFLRMKADADLDQLKFVWALGAALFAQAASCISVYYFDQSFVFLFMNLAIIGSLYSSLRHTDCALVARAIRSPEEVVMCPLKCLSVSVLNDK
jgi:hypothetical protein